MVLHRNLQSGAETLGAPHALDSFPSQMSSPNSESDANSVAPDYGRMDELPHGLTHRRGAAIYTRSRAHPGHLYKWLLHQSKPPYRTCLWTCVHCRKIRGKEECNVHSMASSTSDGRFTTDPDNPKNPHVCTMPDSSGVFDAFTEAHMYAELIVLTIKERVRTENLGQRQIYNEVVSNLPQLVPAEHCQKVREMLPKYRSLLGSLQRAKSKRRADALIGNQTDDAVAPLMNDDDEPKPMYSLSQFQQQLSLGTTFAADMFPELGTNEPSTSGAPATNDYGAVEGDALQLESEPKRSRLDTEEKVKAAKRKAKYTPDRFPLMRLAGTSPMDGTLKRALQNTLVKHELRMFSAEEQSQTRGQLHEDRLLTAKEKSAERIAEYQVVMQQRELEQLESMNKLNIEHARECNKLARERMRLENELIQARTRKVIAEAKQIETGKVPAKSDCEHVGSGDGSTPSDIAGDVDANAD